MPNNDIYSPQHEDQGDAVNAALQRQFLTPQDLAERYRVQQQASEVSRARAMNAAPLPIANPQTSVNGSNPVQDYSTPFIRQRNLLPVSPNGAASLAMNAVSRLGDPTRTFGERDDLLNDINDTFYGGGNAQPRPTPTPTPSPRFLSEINRPRYRVSPQDLQMYGAGADYGFTA